MGGSYEDNSCAYLALFPNVKNLTKQSLNKKKIWLCAPKENHNKVMKYPNLK
jgi:hypothetical protein